MAAETRTLAEFASGLRFESLPDAVVSRTCELIQDLVGVAVRARHDADSTPSLLAAAARLGSGGHGASVFAHRDPWSPMAAALVNGTLAHSLDFDDTHARSSAHPSAPVVPAALAAAEESGASGAELLAGVVAGYEVFARIAIALEPRAHYERGFHPTATCGAFAAAVASARVFGLDAVATESALGIALSQTAGSMQFLANGAWTKRFQVGWAASSGLVAALFAREGFRGAAEALEGESGFLGAYAPTPDPNELARELGSRWETLEIAVKPYPCCRYAHAPIDALIALRSERALESRSIESVEVGLPRAGWNIIGGDAASKLRPANTADAQFSMPFLAAVALREGRVAWDDYARHLSDPETAALAARVRTAVDPRPEAEFPARMSGVVRIEAPEGKLERFVRTPSGEPESFPSRAEQRAKLDGLTAPYLDGARRHALVDAVAGLSRARGVSELFALTR